jgi:hypothetical protein
MANNLVGSAAERSVSSDISVAPEPLSNLELATELEFLLNARP